jgi:hypothetical protein
MSDDEVYLARADAERAMVVAETESPFTIKVRFVGGLTQGQMDAFAAAADRWVKVIVGDLPEDVVDGEVVDDVLILAAGAVIDGPGKILGQALVTHRRRAGDEPWALLPSGGNMTFDKDDLANMEAAGTLGDVITHEMGHVLGIGGTWRLKGLITGAQTDNPRFIGPAAMAEYHKLRGGLGEPETVPVANVGGPGTKLVHWRELDFGNELMTGNVNRAPNPLSRVTAGCLGDLGYQVDIDAADSYTLPELAGLAEVSHRVPCEGFEVA